MRGENDMKNIVDEKKLENIRFQHEYQLSKQIEQGRSMGWMSPLTFLVIVVFIICKIVICAMLISSKSIKEYLYDKLNHHRHQIY
jgi:hypothetical protein